MEFIKEVNRKGLEKREVTCSLETGEEGFLDGYLCELDQEAGDICI